MNGISDCAIPSGVTGCTVIMKLVGSTCNMCCSYCYEEDKHVSHPACLEPTDFERLVGRIRHFPEVRFLLHGGEPLLYPKEKMREILNVMREGLPGPYSVQVQTNGTLIEQDWLELFADHAPRTFFSISLDPQGAGDLRMLPGKEYRAIVRKRIQLVLKLFGVAGVVSVAHRANKSCFTGFLDELVDLGVPYLTINKLRKNRRNDSVSNGLLISEYEYVMLLEYLCTSWINQRLFSRIQIQPLMALLSPSANRICEYHPSSDKCVTFLTLYPGGMVGNCGHLGNPAPIAPQKCLVCPIWSWCGGGCWAEEKDSAFCDARYHFKGYIERLLNDHF